MHPNSIFSSSLRKGLPMYKAASKFIPLIPIFSISSVYALGGTFSSKLALACKGPHPLTCLVAGASIFPLACVGLLSSTLVSEVRLDSITEKINPNSRITIVTEPLAFIGSSVQTTQVSLKDLRLRYVFVYLSPGLLGCGTT